MKQAILVFVGSGVGGVLRLWAGPVIHALLGGFWPKLAAGGGSAMAFPIGTLAVNSIGCGAAGILGGAVAAMASPAREDYRAMLLIGLLGGFTTFSAFARETMQLVGERRLLEAGAYVLASNAIGLAGVWLGSILVPGKVA